MAAAAAVAGVEIVVVDAMQVYRRMDIGTAKPSAADRARRRPPLPRSRRSERRDVGHRVPPRLRRRPRRNRRATNGTGAPRRRYRALSDSGDRPPRPARYLAGRARHPRSGTRYRRPLRPAQGPRPGRRRQDRSGQPPAHPARPRGDDRQRAAVQLVRSRRRRLPADRRRPVRHPLVARRPGRAHRAACPVDDGRRAARRGRPPVDARPVADGGPGARLQGTDRAPRRTPRARRGGRRHRVEDAALRRAAGAMVPPRPARTLDRCRRLRC